MSSQSHIDPSADLTAAQERSPRMSRRSVLRGAAVGSADPIVVYLRDAASGELEVFAGDSQVKLHDPAIAARLSRAVR